MRCKAIRNDRRKLPTRRGAAMLAFVTALLVIGTLVLWLFHVGGAGTSATLGHYLSTGAFYAAESGIEMAAREIGLGVDVDNDSNGTPGTISNNENEQIVPALATGSFRVLKFSADPPIHRAFGRPLATDTPWKHFRRVIEFRMQ